MISQKQNDGHRSYVATRPNLTYKLHLCATIPRRQSYHVLLIWLKKWHWQTIWPYKQPLVSYYFCRLLFSRVRNPMKLLFLIYCSVSQHNFMGGEFWLGLGDAPNFTAVKGGTPNSDGPPTKKKPHPPPVTSVHPLTKKQRKNGVPFHANENQRKKSESD